MSEALPRPKHYILQYLLIPVRVILFIPFMAMLMALSLFIKSYIAGIALAALGILLGAAWIIDTYIWQDFSKSSLAELLGVLSFFPAWIGVMWIQHKIIEWIGSLYGVSDTAEHLQEKVGRYYERLSDFIFEAKYKQPYIELFGPDFPKPAFKDFDLEEEEYYEYNRRFSLAEMEFTIGSLSGLVTGMISSYYFEKPTPFHIGFGVGIGMFILSFTFERWLKRQKPQHYKVQKYSYAKKTYDSVQEDIRKAKHKIEFEEKWAAKMKLEKELKTQDKLSKARK